MKSIPPGGFPREPRLLNEWWRGRALSHLFRFRPPPRTSPQSSAPAHSPPPPPPQPGSEPNPTGMQPGHMRCAGGGRASPPAPQGDLAPSCPDAVTKVMGEIVSHPRQRPKVSQRPSRGPHLAQGHEEMVREEPWDSLRHCLGSIAAATTTITSSLLPLCLCNSLPRRLWPHPMLQHEVIASQSRRARQNTPGADWLRDPPLPLPTPLTKRSGSLWGNEKTETAIAGKDPENWNHHVILVGKPLFYSLASPFFLRNNLSVPPHLITAT